MDRYVTGDMIKRLRERRSLTQQQLADALHVSDKAVSRWETGRGFPDITLLPSLAQQLQISVAELLSGTQTENANRNGNIKRSKIYVCPVCGNVLWSMGSAAVSCCGISLPPLEADTAEGEHEIHTQLCEDEIYVWVEHEMTKEHFVSFLAGFEDDGLKIVKLYPEGNAAARFKAGRTKKLYAFCNRHGLYEKDLLRKK